MSHSCLKVSVVILKPIFTIICRLINLLIVIFSVSRIIAKASSLKQTVLLELQLNLNFKRFKTDKLRRSQVSAGCGVLLF